MASAWAIGALDRAESAELRWHLVGCRRPHPALREALAVAATLVHTVRCDGPSVALRARVLGAARLDGDD